MLIHKTKRMPPDSRHRTWAIGEEEEEEEEKEREHEIYQ